MFPLHWLESGKDLLPVHSAEVLPLLAQAPEPSWLVVIAVLAMVCLVLVAQLLRYRRAISIGSEMLRVSQSQSKRAEDHSPVMTAMISPEGKWLKVPARLCELLNYSESQLLQKPVSNFTNAEDYRRESEECRMLVAGEVPSFRLQKRFRTSDNHTVWCTMNATPVQEKSGKVESIIAYFVDITERKRTEENLRRNEELNRQIIEAGPGGYLIVSTQGRIERANAEALAWLGMEMEELRNKELSAFEGAAFHEDGTPCPVAEFCCSECLRTQEKAGPRTFRYQRKDGKSVWGLFSATPLRDPETGDFTGAIASFVDLTVRKRAEAELAQAMEFLEGVIDNAPAVAIQVFDHNGKVELWNPASARLYGYSPGEMLGHRIQDTLLLPEEVTAFEKMVERLIEHKHSVEPYEWTVRHRDGRMRHVMSSMFAVPQASGAHRICCIDLDISERKQTEEELRRSEERYRAFIRASSEAIWRFECTDPVPVNWPLEQQIKEFMGQATLAECNDAMARMYGYEQAEEIVGRKLSELMGNDPRNREFLKSFIESDYRMVDAESHEIDRHGNRKIFLNNLVGTIKNGQLIRCWGTQRDITDRRLAEERLRRSEGLLRTVLDALPVGVWVADDSGKLILGNPAGKDIWGGVKEVGEFAWKRARGSWHQNGREIKEEEWAVVRALKNGETTLKEEIDIECFDGARKTISYSAGPIRNEAGEIIGAIVVNEDITERMRLEEQLRHSQKMESIGQLAAGVAHDFNNILTIIRGHVDLLLRRQQIPANSRESLEQAAEAADRAASLTRQLLLFSNRQLIQPRQVDLNAVVEDSIRLLRRTLGENIHLDLKCRSALPSLYTDPGMIEQIVANLALNARDAMPSGGRLSIRTDMIDLTAAPADNPAARIGRFLKLEVRDTGMGMDKPTMSRIFEPFFTTKGIGRGTGLGLATVYGIVERHKGWIETDSEPGKGTVFRVYFPVEEGSQEVAPPEPDPTAPAIKGGKETILLVEDEQPLLELVRGVLSDFGYRVLTAPDGVEAIKVWQGNRDHIDLLLTDMMMPHGVSGRDLAKRFISEKPELSVIYSSGYAVELFGDTFETTEACRFLEKPYSPVELLRMVRDMLDRNSAR